MRAYLHLTPSHPIPPTTPNVQVAAKRPLSPFSNIEAVAGCRPLHESPLFQRPGNEDEGFGIGGSLVGLSMGEVGGGRALGGGRLELAFGGRGVLG